MLKALNFKAMMPKAAGLALGTVAAGFIQGFLDKGTLSPMVRAVALIAAGAILPGMAGKNPIIAAAGDGVMSKGIDALLKTTPLGSYVRGVDDNIFGPDDEMNGPESFDDIPGGVTGIVGSYDEMNGADEPSNNTF
jgi:hypothetical protein